MATQKYERKRAATESLGFLAVLAGIAVLLNILGVYFFGRMDLTQKRLFSLSDGSKRVVSELEDRLEVRAYFSKDLPPPHNATERYVRDLLAEYEAASGGKVRVRQLHPETDEERQAAERDGVPRVQDPSYQGDTFSVKEGYRGVSFHYLGQNKAISAITGTTGLEYQITQIIKELTGDKIKIGVLGDHEAASVAKGLSSLRTFLPTYDLTDVKLDKDVDPELRALLVVQPKTAFSEAELKRLDAYVMKGGGLAILGGSMKVDMQPVPMGSRADTGLNQLLEKWGVKLDDSFVADAQCGRARLDTSFGGIGIPVAVPYPPVPIVTFDDEQRKHPSLFRLDQVPLPYPSRITLTDALANDESVKRTVLARSTENSWLLEGDSIPLRSKRPQEWRMTGKPGPHIVAVAIEGKLPSAFAAAPVSTPKAKDAPPAGPDRAGQDVRVIVVGSGFFVQDDFLPRPARDRRQQISSSVAFALNSIDWLSQDSDLIAIRAKDVEEPTLEVPNSVRAAEESILAAVEQQDQKKAEEAFEERKTAISAWDTKRRLYRWSNTLALPGIIALLGVFRWRMRRNRHIEL
ncbi:MAG: GldG family protein [Proteobacteria bacterium]|nr:GldG family protein [Pseudomonadota bacterium]